MDLRPYSPLDRDLCLAVFDSNASHLLDPGARREFEDFLDRRNCSYFVMEHGGALVGCGGYAIDREKALARLLWGMVRADSQSLGLGRYLLLFRLREITKAGRYPDGPSRRAAKYCTVLRKTGIQDQPSQQGWICLRVGPGRDDDEASCVPVTATMSSAVLLPAAHV